MTTPSSLQGFRTRVRISSEPSTRSRSTTSGPRIRADTVWRGRRMTIHRRSPGDLEYPRKENADEHPESITDGHPAVSSNCADRGSRQTALYTITIMILGLRLTDSPSRLMMNLPNFPTRPKNRLLCIARGC